jgi:hypothetical protein
MSIEIAVLHKSDLTDEQVNTITELADKASNYRKFTDTLDTSTWELIEYLLDIHDVVLTSYL